MNKKKKKAKVETHKDLAGFDIHINEFGQIVSTIQQDKFNKFLNKHVDDKKLSAKQLNSKLNDSEEE